MNNEIEEKTTITKVSPDVVKQTTEIYKPKKVFFRAYQIIWYIFGIIEFLLIMRIILKALGASSLGGFTAAIYSLSQPLIRPFSGILENTVNKASVFEWSTLIATVVYILAASALIELIEFIKLITPRDVERKEYLMFRR